MQTLSADLSSQSAPIPWFGARKLAAQLQIEVQQLKGKLAEERQQLETLGALPILELQLVRSKLEQEIEAQRLSLAKDRSNAATLLDIANSHLEEIRQAIVATEDTVLLQEAGVYRYRHPLTDVVAYEQRLAAIDEEIKNMTRKDGGAVLGTTNWSVNNSLAAARAMVRDFSKLMLRAFNAEADNLLRGLKPYKLDGAIDRLKKVSDTIARLGKSMDIRISSPYLRLRIKELELTADYLAKVAEQKEIERVERERLREERKVQQEVQRERERLEKERQHFNNALDALKANGDQAAIARIQRQLDDVNKAIEDVDYRAANIRAGYVYLISNIGSFGENMVKVGMTRRLEPMDRIRELSDASVPFNFDVHALFFSTDAVGIETEMHHRLATVRVNSVNKRREFFRATPVEVKAHLSALAGELLQFKEIPDALEYRQSLSQAKEAH